eukprot:m.23301 g.23301  ORF g.23301 m.23301 type:complete len:668 (+) comp8476_c1_seq1:111-2114(+)
MSGRDGMTIDDDDQMLDGTVVDDGIAPLISPINDGSPERGLRLVEFQRRPGESETTPLQWARICVSFVLIVGVIGAIMAIVFLHNSRDPIAELACGTTYAGDWHPANRTLAVFKGIRFASPPTDKRRFRPAEPVTCEGVSTINAKLEPPACFQDPGLSPAQQSEDCLFLNVFTKGIDDSTNRVPTESADSTNMSPQGSTSYVTSSLLKPTLVWVYGGSNVAGSTTSYPGVENLAIAEDVCLVVPNYRLGVFGYLALQELSGTSETGVSGNYGITDLVAALQWVQVNGRAFGCDPTSVTIYGHSSGGTNINALLSSPLVTKSKNAPLFHRAAMLSGSSNITQSLAETERQHREVLINTPCAKEVSAGASAVVSCLQAMAPLDLLLSTPPSWDPSLAQLQPTRSPSGTAKLAGLVIVDGVTVTKPFVDAVSTKFVDVPLLISGMRDEDDLTPNATIQAWTSDEWDQYLNTTFNAYSNETAAILLSLYGNSRFESVDQLFYDFSADVGVHCANFEIARMASRAFASPVHVLEVDYPPDLPYRVFPGQPASVYPFHGWDFILLHSAWNFSVDVGGQAYQPTRVDAQAAKLFRSALVEFMLTGQSAHLKPMPNTLTGGRMSVESLSDVINRFHLVDVGDHLEAAFTVSEGFKDNVCTGLKQAGFTQSNWWIN